MLEKDGRFGWFESKKTAPVPTHQPAGEDLTVGTPTQRRINLMTEPTKKTTSARKKNSASASGPQAIAPKRKASAKVTEISTVTHEQIAALAHRFWAEGGFQHGHDAEHWLRAEQTLLGKAS